ncbi:MAG: 1,4-alpha-glucan branching enzyme, partial [Lachnospiraceae bacterium]|nr:1,4-alpha-glucan branching enzyme [Lachnospiraceae bacterium]
LWDSGIFELFVPGISVGALYKYEIKAKGGMTYLKADPYANASEPLPGTASVVADLNSYKWSDAKWLRMRSVNQSKNVPMAVYEVDLATFDRPVLQDGQASDSGSAAKIFPQIQPASASQGKMRAGSATKTEALASDTEKTETLASDTEKTEAAAASVASQAQTGTNAAEDSREFFTYRELAPLIADYVKEMGYTHIELMPVMEHTSESSLGYEVTGYYAPTSRFGSPEDFMYFMDYMHGQGIGVILDWVPSQFPRDSHGLSAFDGTYLYEHLDPRKGVHPKNNTLLFNYGRPEVSNYLIANALFWKNVYHADGLRMNAVASMLYLDYDRKEGEWVPNMYGGNENLEAVEFLKHLNSIFKKQGDGAILIAEDASTWPRLTAPVEDGGLGFDYKWNTGWTNDMIGYLQLDPFFRSHHHGDLSLSMIYAYSEDFIVGFSHDCVVNGQGSMLSKMPGKRKMKFANLRAAYGFMVPHPGKKHLFMGQDIGQPSQWTPGTAISWELLEQEEHQQMKAYVKALLTLYRDWPALYQKDYDPEGFEWIDNLSADENVIVFLRKGEAGADDLLVVCNFSPLAYEKYKIGVPYAGKYKEIFNSDSAPFGGSGKINPRVKASKKETCADRENSIQIQVPPMGISVFRCAVEEAAKSAPKPAAKSSVGTKAGSARKTSVSRTAAKAAASALTETTAKETDAKQTAPKKNMSQKSDGAATKSA